MHQRKEGLEVNKKQKEIQKLEKKIKRETSKMAFLLVFGIKPGAKKIRSLARIGLRIEALRLSILLDAEEARGGYQV